MTLHRSVGRSSSSTGSSRHTPRRQIGSIASNAEMDVFAKGAIDRKTHIICTAGPSSWSVENLRALLLEGMDIMRLNFSHGSYVDKIQCIKNLHTALESFRGEQIDWDDGALENYCAIAADTKGPEIRTGCFKNATTVELEAGQELLLSTDVSLFNEGNNHKIYVDYDSLVDEVPVGSVIYVDDGLIGLDVIGANVETGELITRVQNSGVLGQQKGCNIPGVSLSMPALTSQDEEDLAFAASQGVDIVFASFIRRASDIEDVRAALGYEGRNIHIIAKIESVEGVDNFDSILEVCDGVMVARGDLGIEIPPEKVFLAQKMMISKCNVAGKPVICATQMLESMVHNPRATRAECSDVANAVLDGADCVMLSGETAKGKYPMEAVRTMSLIVKEAESAIEYRELSRQLRKALQIQKDKNPSSLAHLPNSAVRMNSVAVGAVLASFELNAALIVVLSRTGRACKTVSKYRPPCPILLVTDDAHVARSGYLHRGVHPCVMESDVIALGHTDPDRCIQRILLDAFKLGMCHDGDNIVVLMSSGRADPVLKLVEVNGPELLQLGSKGIYAPE